MLRVPDLISYLLVLLIQFDFKGKFNKGGAQTIFFVLGARMCGAQSQSPTPVAAPE